MKSILHIAIGSVLIFTPAWATASPESTFVLTGRIESAAVTHPDWNEVVCTFHLHLVFENRGDEPVIFLRPNASGVVWCPCATFSSDPLETNPMRCVAGRSVGCLNPNYDWLADRLNSREPPGDLLETLAPGEVWAWDTEATLFVDASTSRYRDVITTLGWDSLPASTQSLWMRLNFELWPANADYFPSSLGRDLKLRWAKYGQLQVGERAPNYYVAAFPSEPIEWNRGEAVIGTAPN